VNGRARLRACGRAAVLHHAVFNPSTHAWLAPGLSLHEHAVACVHAGFDAARAHVGV
jgi:hypothetical protein